MSRQKKGEDVPVGQDSFLDVVSNLVGVIIIVVLIIAVAASADSAIDEVNSDTAETERETAETYALITKLEAAARDADAHLNRFLADTRHPRD